MTSISALHNSTALTLLKGATGDSSQPNKASAASQILAAVSTSGLLPDSMDMTGKIMRILLDHGELIVGGSFSEITGTDGDDIITAGPGSTVNAGAGDDYIEVTIASTVNGGAGDDVIRGGVGNKLNGGDGNDKIRAIAKNTVNGGAGNDLIDAFNDNVIDAGSGADRISAAAGNVVTGGSGNDVITLNGWYGGNNPMAGTGSVVKYAAGDGADVLNLVGSASTLELTDGISAANTHISIADNKATITFDGSDTDSITVQLTPDASLAVKFSDGSSRQISFDASKDFNWALDPKSLIEHAKGLKSTPTIDPAAIAALRAYSQA